MKTDHTIFVNSASEDAFAIGLDVTQWPEIFPPCLDAKVLDESETRQTIALTARANDQIFSWQSVRNVDRQKRRISFQQQKTSPLVKSMRGTWSFEDEGDGCLIRLTHEFEVADDVADVVPGVATRKDAADFMMSSIESNSTRELGAIARHLERKAWSHRFAENLLIDAAPEVILDLLWDAQEWPSLLQHCTGMEVLYDDGANQEFVMVVQVGETSERIRSIRRKGDEGISYFQPTPPDPLLEHRGRWSFRATPEGTEVTSFHDVVLNAPFWEAKGAAADDAKQTVENAINRNSLGTMTAIKNRLGRL